MRRSKCESPHNTMIIIFVEQEKIIGDVVYTYVRYNITFPGITMKIISMTYCHQLLNLSDIEG